MMVGAIYHNKSDTALGFSGTVTVHNRSGATITIAASDLVRPLDWNIPHDFHETISGNTAGASTWAGQNLVLAGGPFITLSMNTAANAATVSFVANADAGYQSRYTAFGRDANTLTVALTTGNASIRVLRILEPITFTRLDVPVFASAGSATNSRTAAAAITSVFVIYTSDSNFSLNPVVGLSGQTTYSWASNSANWSSMTGPKYVSFNIATSLLPGEYFCGWQIRTATTSIGTGNTTALSLSISLSVQGVSALSGSSFTDFGVTASASTNSFFGGVHTNTITATNQTIAMSNVTVTGTANYAANFPVIFRNL